MKTGVSSGSVHEHGRAVFARPAEFEAIIRFLKYSVAGFSGIFVDMGMLFLLSDPSMLNWPAPLGKALAVEAAILNNFIWNDWWTFRDKRTSQSGFASGLARLARFNLICLAGLAIGVAFLWLFHGLFGMNLYAANLLAIAAALSWNFGMSCRFSWGMKLGGRTSSR